MTQIFISYRRVDSQDITARLVDSLVDRLGDEYVFRDIYDIDPGRDFTEVLREALSGNNVVLPVIGNHWVAELWRRQDAHRAGKTDWVFEEIATALQAKKLIVPILVHGATMPSPNDIPSELHDLLLLAPQRIDDECFETQVEALFKRLLDHDLCRPLLHHLLEEAFNFTADDLKQNQAGRRSSRQSAISFGLDIEETSSLGVSNWILYGVGCVFMIMGILVMLLLDRLSVSNIISGCACTALFLPGAVFIAFLRMIAATKLESIEGIATYDESNRIFRVDGQILTLMPGQSPQRIIELLGGKRVRVFVKRQVAEWQLMSMEPVEQL